MEIRMLVFVCLLQVKTVFTLQCFKCMTKNEESCLTSQKEKSCPTHQSGACMIVSYKTEKDGAYTTTFKKGCAQSYSRCEEFCSSTIIADGKNCKVKCCTTDRCNAHGIKKPEVYQDKNKRSTTEDKSSVTTKELPGLLIISFLCLATFIFNS